MQEQERRRRRQANLTALAPYLRPRVVAALKTPPPEGTRVSAVGRVDDRSLNLVQGGRALYAPDAITFAERQIDAHRKNPTRILFKTLDIDPRRELTMQFHTELFKHVKALPSSDVPPTFGGYLVSIGCGIGAHIPLLLEEYACRNLIMVEPVFDFFDASLDATDWTAIVETIENRGGRIHFFFDADPAVASRSIVLALRDRDHPLIEGSVLFQHHSMAGAQAIGTRLGQSAEAILSYNGWLEDELLHLRNHMANISNGRPRIVGPRQSDHTEHPAYIVGSGPSLANALTHLRENRERAVIFSCGSALRVLLSHGIRPDFHVELENVHLVAHMIGETAEEFDLSGITLIASTTVNPAVIHHFDETVFFHRDSNAVIKALCGRHHLFSQAGRTVTTAALGVAHSLGFSDICLFGVDFGSIHTDRHHADGVLYTAGKNRRRNPLGGGSAGQEFRHTVKGNFRETVNTNDTFLYMRRGLGDLIETLQIETPSFTVRNASDGAFIDHTIPTRPADLVCRGDGGRKRDLVSGIIAACPRSEATDGQGLKESIATFSNDAVEWLRLVNDTLESNRSPASKDKQGFDETRELLLRIACHLHNDWDAARGGHFALNDVKGAVTGTMLNCLHIAHHYVLSKPEATSHSVHVAVLTALENLVRGMAGQIFLSLLDADCEIDPAPWRTYCGSAYDTDGYLRHLINQDDGDIHNEHISHLDGAVARQIYLRLTESLSPKQVHDISLNLLRKAPRNELLILAVLERHWDRNALWDTFAGRQPNEETRRSIKILKEALTQLSTAEPTYFKTSTIALRCAFDIGDFAAAANWARWELEASVNSVQATFILAQSLLLSGSLEESLSLYRSECAPEVSNPLNACFAALAEFIAGNRTHAIEEWSKLKHARIWSDCANALLDAANGRAEPLNPKEIEDIWTYRWMRRLFDIAITANAKRTTLQSD